MQLRLVIIALLCLWLPCSCSAGDSVLAQWDFSKAPDMLGWASAGGTISLDKAEGALTISGTECRLVSPLFDIEATPWQAVEIVMKAERSGNAVLFYSNTTAEPYGGFRGGLEVHFPVTGDGEYHRYTVFPCWQKQGKIIHIRIDPPGNTGGALKSVSIHGLKPTSSSRTNWSFARGQAGWRGVGVNENTGAPKGWGITGNRQSVALSPAINAPADKMPWLTLRLASDSPGVVLFRWISEDLGGLQSLPIEVKGGGKAHSYVIDLSKVSQWNGRILAVGVTPTDSTNSSAIILDSLTLAREPAGPAEIRITGLRVKEPFNRAGDKATLLLEVTNIGGAEARRVTATATLVAGEAPRILPLRSANSLPPVKSILFEWEQTIAEPGTVSVASSATAAGTEADQKQAQFTVYPKLDKAATEALTYVPEPVPADTGDYLVGCYNFPGWIDYGRWSVLDGFPERRPILGYYHDGNPEVADWQINWALEHGIGFMIYDWYWSKGGRHLEEGLHDGFLKAKYQDRMKFCLLWANHNGPGSHSEADMMAVTRYWIDNYFRRPNYLKLGGKNVIVIFTPRGITDDMGVEGARAAFSKMRKLCEDSGVGGLYLIACSGAWSEQIKQIESAGYDAISGYNYPSAGDKGQNVAPYSWMVDAYEEIWDQIDSMSGIPYIPLSEAGWDSRPWHGPGARVRTGKSADLWQKMLQNAKVYNDSPNRKLPEGRKLVFMEAWNEFGEGDYIEPTAGDGFSYLEAVRQVFAPRSRQPRIVIPKDIGMGPYDIPKPVLRTSWDFARPEERNWAPGGFAEVSYDGGSFSAVTTGADATLSAGWVEIDASKLRNLEVKMKIDKPGEAQLFFRGKNEQLSESKSVKIALIPDSNFHTYTVDLAANPAWRGTIQAIRFDPTSASGAKVEIAYILFK